MSKNNHKNKIRNWTKIEKVIVLEINTVLVYVGCIIFLFIICKYFILPLKSIVKIIGNSVLGGILIFIVNAIGTLLNFHVGLNIGTALITGVLGIPRCCIINCS